MLKTIVVLPDGTQLHSGLGTKNAIKSITLTQCVNEGQELSLGSACANMAELTVIAPEGGFSIAEGDEFTLYRQDGEGVRRKVGLFISEKPLRAGSHTWKVTAYDRMIRLDKDLTPWLESLTGWPYSLYEFARMTCRQCGLELANEEIPNGPYQVQKFSAQGITGRTILKWVGQIAGRFCRATADGKIEFAWYTPAQTVIGAKELFVRCTAEGGEIYCPGARSEEENVILPGAQAAYDGAGEVEITLPDSPTYYQGSLRYSDYRVAPVEKVQIKASAKDVGTVYPENLPDSVNTYVVSGNYLLTAADAHTLKAVAQSLYELLAGIRYTPCTVRLPAGFSVQAGNTVDITDPNGVTITAFVMTKRQAGQADTLECTGSPSRSSSSAVNQISYQALSGKMLELNATVDGLKLENRDNQGKMAEVSLQVSGISSQVQKHQADMEGVHQQLTQIKQNEAAVELQVKQMQQQGVGKVTTQTGFTFDEKGLTISRSGSGMENLLDERGMSVKRFGKVILRADQEGVTAVDVSVGNYLVIGDHARLEDYGNNRTACFWI